MRFESIIYQPIHDYLGNILIEKLTNREITFDNLYIIVAFAKKSGVSKIQQALTIFRRNGGKIKVVVGIDSKGTTIEGLELLYNLCDEVYVFHDNNPLQNFHPKIYILEKEGEYAEIYIGSSNLTRGGLFSNYEGNIGIILDLGKNDEKEIFDEFIQLFNYYSNINDEHNRCKQVNNELITQLEDLGYLDSEIIQQSIRTTPRIESEEQLRLEEFTHIFGSASFEIEEIETAIIPVIDDGFWKKLSNNDVSLTSSPGQIIIPKRFLAFLPPFINWRDMPSGGRQADIFFDVKYIDKNGVEQIVKDARAIYYIPAPHHPRPNQEIRFTFRNKEILRNLTAGDILEFRRTSNSTIWFVITQLNEEDPRYRRYSSTGKKCGIIS